MTVGLETISDGHGYFLSRDAALESVHAALEDEHTRRGVSLQGWGPGPDGPMVRVGKAEWFACALPASWRRHLCSVCDAR